MKMENDICPVCLETFKRSDKVVIKVKNKRIYFCSGGCKEKYLLEQRKLERLGFKGK